MRKISSIMRCSSLWSPRESELERKARRKKWIIMAHVKNGSDPGLPAGGRIPGSRIGYDEGIAG